MAPWPEQGNELKNIADKENEIRSPTLHETQNPKVDSNLPEDKVKAKSDEDPQVHGLDEGQLKALLDEAINYKNPKDREGKSELFKELLQEVEADDKEDINLKNQINNATNSARFNRNRRQHSARHISERQRSGGSLQNLVYAYTAEVEAANNKRRNKNLRGSNINVSARQREGGSLPSNVNHVQGVSGMSTSLFDDYKRNKEMPAINDDKPSSESGLCTDYSSSTNCHSRKTSSTWGDDDNSIELEDMRGTARTYTTRASLDVQQSASNNTSDSSSDGYSYATGEGSGNKDVDATILFPIKSKMPSIDGMSFHMNPTYNAAVRCLVSPDSANSKNENGTTTSYTKSETSSNVISTLSIPPHRLNMTSSEGQTDPIDSSTPSVSMLLHGLYHPFHARDLFTEQLHSYASGATSSLDKGKSYDENANALSLSDKKKFRRKKNEKNEKNTYYSESVDGFLGDKNIEELLMFIENDGGQKKANKGKVAQKQKKPCKDDSEQPKKRKGKEKLTKCNSLEEISKTKIEDLTSSTQVHRGRPKKQVTLDDEQLRWHEDDNSISADEALGRKRKDNSNKVREKEKEKERKTDDESEFRLVQTKKHRRRKRNSISSHTDQIRQTNAYTRHSSPERRHHRTSSMPPSDRSDCSDLDSVHSLPVTSAARERRSNEYSNNNNSKQKSTNHSKTNSCSSSSNSINDHTSIHERERNSHDRETSKKNTKEHEREKVVESKRNHEQPVNASLSQETTSRNESKKNKDMTNHDRERNSHDRDRNDAKKSSHDHHERDRNETKKNHDQHHPNTNSHERDRGDAKKKTKEKDSSTRDSGCKSVLAGNHNNNNTAVANMNGFPEGNVCNGVAEDYETVTLPLNNNHTKLLAGRGSSARTRSASEDCDVFVEFNLPPPPPPPSSCPNSKPKYIDVTVEKTVIIKSQHSMGVSESVSLVIPPPPATTVHHSSGGSRKHRSSNSSYQHHPPVILIDSRDRNGVYNGENQTSSSDLTFGFEINRELLESNSQSVKSNATSTTTATSPDPPTSGSAIETSYLSQECNTSLREYFNYQDIVNFVSKAWKDVMKELSDPKSSIKVNYYSTAS